jgi:hypothetical protein
MSGHHQPKARNHRAHGPALGALFRHLGGAVLGLQQDYELDVARDKAAVRIRREVLPRAS